jgi:hypothetical protein
MIKNYVRVFFFSSDFKTCIHYIIFDNSKRETLVRRAFAICDITSLLNKQTLVWDNFII